MEIQKQKELLNKICPLKKGYVNSRREVRVDFFNNIQTEIQAYLLGFYVADGSIPMYLGLLILTLLQTAIIVI